MSNENLMLYVATYPDAGAAAEDFDALKDARRAGGFEVRGAVVVSRDADGKISVHEHGTSVVAGGATLGGAAGLVVGLFAPPLLLSGLVGARLGAVAGELRKRHEEKQLGADLEESLPPGSSAVVVLVDDVHLDRVQAALRKAEKKASRAVDSGDVEQLEKALGWAPGRAPPAEGGARPGLKL